MDESGAAVTFRDVVAAEGAERESLIDALVSRMTLDEKIGQMTGSTSTLVLLVMAIRYGLRTFDSGSNERLGIPPLRFTDGPRGVCLDHSTCFPVAIARGASWDPDLQERISSAIGVEARSQGADFYGGVCINLLRHPGWGRAQETFGEDPFHLGVMGVAAVKGAQEHLMACAKHFACNSIEEARFSVDVRIDERTLREIYLPHFKKCVDAGVASIMSAYNRVNGHYCGQNAHLLRDILKGEWGFDGLVMSDFVWGLRDGPEGARAGLDVEMPKKWRYGWSFKRKVRKGEVKEELLDDAVRRVVRQKARFFSVGDASLYAAEKVACAAHRELALEAARKGIVLLKNEGGALPIDARRVEVLAVIGPLADEENIGDRGSSRVSPPLVVTALEGIREKAGGRFEVLHQSGRDLARARRAAAAADAAVVVVGLTGRDEGEYLSKLAGIGGDREDLDLPRGQGDLVKAVARDTDRCIVVLEGGSAITMEDWKGDAAAILMAWYPGMEGGRAIADVLFGDVNPSGRLPVTFPASTSQLPFFDRRAEYIEYGYYHGYRLFDRDGNEPAFAFGHGLSYTSFEYSDLLLDSDRIPVTGRLRATFQVENTGDREGDEVAQLYIGHPASSVDRPEKELEGFARVSLEPGEKKTISIDVDAAELAYYDESSSAWTVEETGYEVMVGSSSRDEDLVLKAGFEVAGA